MMRFKNTINSVTHSLFLKTKNPLPLCKTGDMVIDIRRTAIRMRLRGLITAFVFFIIILILLVVDFFSDVRMYLVLSLSFIYVANIIYSYLKDYYYIYFSDEGNKILFRYYSMRPLSQAKRSIEIPKGNLARYEIITGTLGLRTKIIFYQKVKEGVYKYPPVNISALSKLENDQLVQTLNKLL